MFPSGLFPSSLSFVIFVIVVVPSQEVARVTCGYSVAFVLQCFVPFFALVQAWLYLQIHRVVPNSGEGIGVFLIKKRDESDALEVHVRTPKQGGRIVLPPGQTHNEGE